ncbi:MAG TPA: hypothetical protein VMV50_02425 [Candidatus Paceibacterota bacterium]|nr:hypothetical protein [Candidatus Paceibacterota bacterium]
MNGLTFDRPRAEAVFGTILEAYGARSHLYRLVHGANDDAPQRKFRPANVIPGSRDDLIRLYFAALTDRRQLSNEVYKTHARLWITHEWLYREEVLRRFSSWKELARILRHEKVGVPEESARNWLLCADTLYRMFGGNPLQLYRENSIDGTLAWKRSEERRCGFDALRGFGPKILSLLAMFYEELGVLPHVEGAFPVDVHIQRICISTSVVRGVGVAKSAAIVEFLRPQLCEVCYARRWKPLNLAHALWFIGNRECTRCHLLKDVHVRCPLYAACGGTPDSRAYFRRGEWDFDAPRRPKGFPVKLLF